MLICLAVNGRRDGHLNGTALGEPGWNHLLIMIVTVVLYPIIGPPPVIAVIAEGKLIVKHEVAHQLHN